MFWMPVSKPKVLNSAKLDNYEKIDLGNDLVKFIFTINSTSLSSVYIHPKNNAEMISWNLSDEFEDVGNKTYLISMSNGLESEVKPFQFEVILKTSNVNQPLIDITIVTTRSDRSQDYTNEFKKLIKRFPDWTFVVSLVASVNAYTY
jgi:hypothetical protein